MSRARAPSKTAVAAALAFMRSGRPLPCEGRDPAPDGGSEPRVAPRPPPRTDAGTESCRSLATDLARTNGGRTGEARALQHRRRHRGAIDDGRRRFAPRAHSEGRANFHAAKGRKAIIDQRAALETDEGGPDKPDNFAPVSDVSRAPRKLVRRMRARFEREAATRIANKTPPPKPAPPRVGSFGTVLLEALSKKATASPSPRPRGIPPQRSS